MKEPFIDKNFRTDTLHLISMCDEILTDYEAQGYDLTLRQLYYQLVSRDIIPNTQQSYSRLGGIVNDARLAGLLDWDAIVDRGRETVSNPHWTSPASILRSAAYSFHIDKWRDQSNHIEVMVEKQALEGVLIPVCEQLDVNFTANKGYSSQSFMYRKGKALRRKMALGKTVHILYLGDHDPSGLDMDRDVAERLTLFSSKSYVRLQRLALTRDQIDEYQPPENPAKLTDSRAENYIQMHGYSSWELDALEPRALAKLVTDAVIALRDPDDWADACAREQDMKNQLTTWADKYEDTGAEDVEYDDWDDEE